MSSSITSAQIKGNYITFRQAGSELRHRCETTRAHELMGRPVKGKKVKGLISKTEDDNKADVEGIMEQVSGKIMGLISTMSKRHNAPGTDVTSSDGKKGKQKVKQECLAADCCTEFTVYSLCPLHYHSLVSAKIPSLKLRNGYGEATFNTTTSMITYPPKTPSSRLPFSGPKKVPALSA